MNQNTMTSKDLHLAAKRPDGISYLMERFDIPSKEELFEVIRKVSPSHSDSFIKQLMQKEKQFNKKKRQTCVKQKEPIQVEPKQMDMQVQGPDKKDVEEQQAEPDEVTAEIEKSLEELKAEEKELSDATCKLEVMHKEAVANKNAAISYLENMVKGLEYSRRLVCLQEENTTKYCEDYDEWLQLMLEINEQRKNHSKRLKAIRARISELEKITIFVFENGTIDVENAEVPHILQDNVTNKFNELIFRPEAMDADITAKQIQTIAKLLLMTESYRKDHRTFEVEFDSKELQKFYETVAA